MSSEIVMPEFPANPGAQAAWQRVEDAYQRVDDVFGEVPHCSVGAPGSAATLKAAATLIEQAVTLLESVRDSREEDMRFRHWRQLHDSDPV